jgi:hypothetical protein
MQIRIALAALAAMTAVHVHAADYIAPPLRQSFLTNDSANPFVLLSGTTNLAGLTVQVPCVIGENGYSVALNCASTNSAATTNILLVLEHSFDGLNFCTNQTASWVAAVPGMSYGPTATNFFQTEPSGAVGNVFSVRLRTLINSNAQTVWITNLSMQTRLARPKRGK